MPNYVKMSRTRLIGFLRYHNVSSATELADASRGNLIKWAQMTDNLLSRIRRDIWLANNATSKPEGTKQ